MRYIALSLWFCLGMCAALDGLGAAWWHWPWVVGSTAALLVALLREDLRSRRAQRRADSEMPRWLEIDRYGRLWMRKRARKR